MKSPLTVRWCDSSEVGHQTINAKLGEKPSGCVVWMGFDRETLAVGPFYWFGDAPGSALPDISGFKKAKHSKANAKGQKLERRNSYILKRTDCQCLDSLDHVLDELFSGRRTSLGL